MFVRTAPPPGLERACVSRPGLPVEVVGIENQRFPLGIENPAIRSLSLTVLCDVVDFGNVKIAGTHQVTNIPVVGKQVLLFPKLHFAVAELTMEVSNFRLQAVGARLDLGTFLSQGLEFRLSL